MADQPNNPPLPDEANIAAPPDSTPYGSPTINVQSTDYEDPPRPNQNDFWAAQAAEQVYYTAYWFLVDHHVPRWFAWLLSGVAGVAVGLFAYVIAAGFWTLTKIGEPFAEFVIGTMSEARKQLDPGLPRLAADILGELTGADIKPGDFPTGQGFAGHLARVQSVGGQLHTLLESEFAPDGAIGPDQGALAAKAFTGFNINFGIGTAIMSLLGEIETLGKVQQFRELGVEVARNLGLGRLSRQALQPLIKTCIAEPYTWHLNAKYRPTRLSEERLTKALFRGAITEATYRSELSELGYSEARIDEVLAQAYLLLGDRDLIQHTFRFGATTVTVGGQTSPDLKTLLMRRGYSSQDADRLIDVSRPILEKNEIGVLFANGKIDQPTALAYMGKLGYDDATAQLALEAHSITHLHPRHLGLSILKKAFHDNVIDLLEFKAQLTAQGYSADDQNIIVLEVLQPTHGKVRQLSLAEIKAAYKAGAIIETVAAEHLKSLGFSDADIGVILKTFTPPKPPSTATPGPNQTPPTTG